jgi:molecular chaperone Hsp33
MEPIVALEREIRFDCPCSREGFASRLSGLGREELTDLAENGSDPVEVVCHNCGSVYRYPGDEIRKMIKA